MADNEIRNILPVVERRTPEKPALSEKPSGEAFQKEFQAAVNRNSGATGIQGQIETVGKAVAQTSREISEAQDKLRRLQVEMQILRNTKDK